MEILFDLTAPKVHVYGEIMLNERSNSYHTWKRIIFIINELINN